MEDSPWADEPTIVGERVVLRPFTTADVEAMGPVLADLDVLRLTGSVHTTARARAASPVLDAASTCGSPSGRPGGIAGLARRRCA